MYFILILIFFYSISRVMDISFLGVGNDSPWWCYFTFSLIHLSIIHLIMNSFVFTCYWKILKKNVNLYFLVSMMILVPPVAAFLGNADIPTVGLSSVVFTMIGIYVVVIPLAKKALFKFIFLIILSFIFMGLFMPSINTPIHIYSFLISLAISLLSRRFIYAAAK